MTEPRYPDITIPLTGEDGNVFFIMGRCTKALRRAGAEKSEIKEFTNQMTAGDYDHALQTVMKWFRWS